MNIEESFNKFYRKFINENKEVFSEIEMYHNKAVQERKNNKKIICIVEIILLTITILWIAVFEHEERNDTIPELCGVVALLFPMMIALKNKQKLEKYEDIYQEKIIKYIIQYFSPNLEYYPHANIGYEDYQKMGTENFTEFNSSNVVKGLLKNNDIIVSKIITKYTYTYKSYNGLFENGRVFSKKINSEEKFDGIFIKAKLSKNIKTDLYIKSKKHLEERLFNNFIENINHTEKKNIKSIDINELNQTFSIYSSNIDYCIKMLDWKMNKTLLNIYDNQNFDIVIKDNYIYIRFWIAGLFSNPTLKRNVNDKDILYKNYRMFYLTFYLLEKFEEKIN